MIEADIFVHRDRFGKLESVDWLKINKITTPVGVVEFDMFVEQIQDDPEDFFCDIDFGRAMVATIELSSDYDDGVVYIYCQRLVKIIDEYPESSFIYEVGCETSSILSDEIPF